jgi:hypothetical protein
VNDASVLERRREALKTAARLQRRNIGIRWRIVRGKRSVQWVESGVAATRTLRHTGAPALASTAAAARELGWLASALRLLGDSRGGFFSAALRMLQKPSLLSVAMLVARWWWRRHRRARREARMRSRVFVLPRARLAARYR